MNISEIENTKNRSGSVKDTVRHCYKQFVQLSAVDGASAGEALAEEYKRLEMGIFRLVVMGEIKKGKSSFINALLSEPDLLPIASDIATSTVYKLLYGPKKTFKVFFKPDLDTGVRRAPLEIGAEGMTEWGTESGNPNNEKGVDFIGVQLPNELLKQGLVIVDTPGVGGLYRKHRDVTLRYAPNADAVLFVLDSVESVISRDEIEFLKDLVKNSTKRIFFVQTKTDAASEDDWKAWKDRNQSILAAEVGLPVERQVYFPVSAKVKVHADKRKSGRHLEKSGYLEVLNYLNKALIPAKETALASDFATRLVFSLDQYRSIQQQSARMLREESKEKLAEMQQALGEKKRELSEWSGTRFRQETQVFADRLADLKRHSMFQLRSALDPNGMLVQGAIDDLKMSDNVGAREISDGAEAIQQEVISATATVVKETYEEFNNKFKLLIEDSLKSLAASIPDDWKGDTGGLAESDVSSEQDLGMHFSLFETARTSLYGGMAGGMMATFGVGLVGIVFPPALALAAFAPYVGAAVGSLLGGHDSSVRQKNEAISRIRQALMKVVGTAQRKALEQFDEMSVRLERQSRELFQKTVTDFEQSIQVQIEEVKVVAKSTREENMKQLALAEARIKKSDAIIAVLRQTFNSKT
ncbi:MAG: dynamin family protein [Opitutaceae bacterium]